MNVTRVELKSRNLSGTFSILRFGIDFDRWTKTLVSSSSQFYEYGVFLWLLHTNPEYDAYFRRVLGLESFSTIKGEVVFLDLI